MDKMLQYTKSTGLFTLMVLAILVAGGVIAVVVNAATWEQFSDWMTKALIVGLVVVVLGAVIGALAGMFGSHEK